MAFCWARLRVCDELAGWPAVGRSGMASHTSGGLQDVGWGVEATAAHVSHPPAASPGDHVVPKPVGKSSFQCEDALQVSVCIVFAMVLLAKESLLVKPNIPVTGSQGGEEFVPIFAIVLVMSSRICHFSLLSPPPPLVPKLSPSLVWLFPPCFDQWPE